MSISADYRANGWQLSRLWLAPLFNKSATLILVMICFTYLLRNIRLYAMHAEVCNVSRLVGPFLKIMPAMILATVFLCPQPTKLASAS